MKKDSKFIVPKKDRKEFDRLIQRANRRIQANLKYIQQEDIKSDVAKRALVSDYVDQSNWATGKTVFSRSKSFSSEKAYKQYLKHVKQWGAKKPRRNEEKIKKGYYKAIINALTTTAIDNGGGGILTKSGRLPGNIAKQVKELSLEQMTHFFAEADPAEDLEYLPYSGEDYIGVDRQQFIDITESKLNALKKIYPAKSKTPVAAKRRKSVRRKKKKA